MNLPESINSLLKQLESTLTDDEKHIQINVGYDVSINDWVVAIYFKYVDEDDRSAFFTVEEFFGREDFNIYKNTVRRVIDHEKERRAKEVAEDKKPEAV